MAQGRSGISADTPDRLVLDAGEVYFNISVSDLESTDIATALAAGTLVGATRGGSSFTPGRTLRDIPADGKMGPVKGLIRRQNVAPVLTVNLLEITPDSLTKAIAGATGADTGATTDDYQKITGGPILASSYITNVALLATYSGTDNPVIVLVENAIVMDAPTLGTVDEDEVVLAASFAGTFDSATPAVEPWAIYHPTTIA